MHVGIDELPELKLPDGDGGSIKVRGFTDDPGVVKVVRAFLGDQLPFGVVDLESLGV